MFVKQGTALTLTVNTDANTQCLEVINGSNAVIATIGLTSGTQSTWTLSDTTKYPWLVAGGGSGVVQYTTRAWRNYNRPQDKCTANQNEQFGLQVASYTLDNTAPTATAGLSPAPNDAGWNRSDVTVTCRFAAKEVDRFAGVACEQRPSGPAISDALAWIECRLQDEHEAGDHTIVVRQSLGDGGRVATRGTAGLLPRLLRLLSRRGGRMMPTSTSADPKRLGDLDAGDTLTFRGAELNCCPGRFWG